MAKKDAGVCACVFDCCVTALPTFTATGKEQPQQQQPADAWDR